jgi:phosphoesterase RecJ-like protein
MTGETERQVAAIARTIAEGQRFLITSHRDPDGDAIGCMVATLIVLDRLGKDALAYNPDPVPQRYRFLHGTDRLTRALPNQSFDVTLVLDCNDSGLLGGVALEGPRFGKVVVVDHHKTPGDLGDIVLRDATAAAVGVLLFRIFEKLRVELTPEVAEALFCSVMSDTGSFRYQNTNAEAMRVAATLLEQGVDVWRVSSKLYEERPANQLELLGRVLDTLELSPDGRAASLTVTSQMLEETGCTQDMVDGFINYARGVQGVEVAVLLRVGPRGVRVSLRSRGTVDVSRIAEKLGGGGHHNAAGYTSNGEVEEVRAELFAEVRRTLEGAEA